ncbi:hypothetical protein CROQUDRAFT_659417 [Cronartium quercuum f. sp. fusiforme G11]|uniref:Uncharacterized protein n=1 Tax=Cronartium quercuum f. sp. fusiforme G11 TaxID=708437 RepID=A0A9P6NDR4_9BASI|nr:hypothetical protein CROQUDRAFT_659417 [Cronartium quercuum f. sp. fusiforme G11]
MLTADDLFDVGIYKEAIPPSSHWLLLSEIPLLSDVGIHSEAIPPLFSKLGEFWLTHCLYCSGVYMSLVISFIVWIPPLNECFFISILTK